MYAGTLFLFGGSNIKAGAKQVMAGSFGKYQNPFGREVPKLLRSGSTKILLVGKYQNCFGQEVPKPSEGFGTRRLACWVLLLPDFLFGGSNIKAGAKQVHALGFYIRFSQALGPSGLANTVFRACLNRIQGLPQPYIL